MDEPTSGLDPKERIRFRNMISSLSKGNAARSDVERFSKLIQKYTSFEELDSFMQLARKIVLIRPSELCVKPCKLIP